VKLYNYFRSSASYRVRIALNLKGLRYDYQSVHLSRGGGEQFSPAFQRMNPQSLVPVLEDGAKQLTQSIAIIEYVEDTHPTPPLLPSDPAGRARVRELALSIACDVHPLNNLRVLSYLTRELGVSEEAKNRWYQHWVALGLQALEAQIAGSPDTGLFCHGDVPGLADCCLVPQLFNARRFKCDLSAYPTLVEIEQRCNAMAAFRDAAPEHQPDADAP
jgi:maleylacetoacetate isomerase